MFLLVTGYHHTVFIATLNSAILSVQPIIYFLSQTMASHWFIVSQLQIHPCWLLSETVSGLYIFFLCQLALRFYQQGALERRCRQKFCLLALGGSGSASASPVPYPRSSGWWASLEAFSHHSQIPPSSSVAECLWGHSPPWEACPSTLEGYTASKFQQHSIPATSLAIQWVMQEAEPCPHRNRHIFWIWIFFPPYHPWSHRGLIHHSSQHCLIKNSFHSKEKTNNALNWSYHRHHLKVASQTGRYKWLLKTRVQSKLRGNTLKGRSKTPRVKAEAASRTTSPSKRQFCVLSMASLSVSCAGHFLLSLRFLHF